MLFSRADILQRDVWHACMHAAAVTHGECPLSVVRCHELAAEIREESSTSERVEHRMMPPCCACLMGSKGSD